MSSPAVIVICGFTLTTIVLGGSYWLRGISRLRTMDRACQLVTVGDSVDQVEVKLSALNLEARRLDRTGWSWTAKSAMRQFGSDCFVVAYQLSGTDFLIEVIYTGAGSAVQVLPTYE